MPEPSSITAKLEAAARSAWLWPDPFEAPDVPSRVRLEAMLAGVERDPELALQVAASPNCRRAVEEIKATGCRSADELTALLAPTAQPLHSVTRPALGAVWITSPEVEVFDPTRRASLRWRLSGPPVALLVEGPFIESYDRFWRAVLATPEEERPRGSLREDEIVVTLLDGSRWHAHLKLEFPVSEDQLGLPLGELDLDSAENLEVARGATDEALPLPFDTGAGSPEPRLISAEERTERRRERDQLSTRAQWLAATAEARREEAESWAGVERFAAQFASQEAAFRQWGQNRPRPAQAAAGGHGESLSECFAWDGAYSALCQAVIAGRDPEGMKSFSARLLFLPSEHAERSGQAIAKWELFNAPEGLRSGDSFQVVREYALFEILGHGSIEIGERTIASLKQGSIEVIERAMQSGQRLTLLFPGR